MTELKMSLQITKVKAHCTSPDGKVKEGDNYTVIYTREDTFPDGTSGVVIALQIYNEPVAEYPIEWFSLENWEEPIGS
tara:strand:+ start:439 stop:672 length:234 start_codon:yes stop_codon:yes gene_type:complete